MAEPEALDSAPAWAELCVDGTPAATAHSTDPSLQPPGSTGVLQLEDVAADDEAGPDDEGEDPDFSGSDDDEAAREEAERAAAERAEAERAEAERAEAEKEEAFIAALGTAVPMWSSRPGSAAVPARTVAAAAIMAARFRVAQQGFRVSQRGNAVWEAAAPATDVPAADHSPDDAVLASDSGTA